MPLKKGMFILGLVILGTVVLWNSPVGFEWLFITAQVVVGAVLIAKSRVKAKPIPQH
jgi:hypothetical protein